MRARRGDWRERGEKWVGFEGVGRRKESDLSIG